LESALEKYILKSINFLFQLVMLRDAGQDTTVSAKNPPSQDVTIFALKFVSWERFFV